MKYLKYLFTLYFTSLFMIPCFSLDVPEDTPIRVAFLPQQEGFYHIEENGGYAGYNYDYLMEISEYTGWTYEFIVIDEGWNSYNIAKDMVQAGEIDLLGPMFSSDSHADDFLYGSKPNGLSRHTLCTTTSSNLTMDNYFFQENITVALEENNQASIDAFYSLMDRYDLSYEITFVQSQSEALELLIQRKVQTIMSMDVFHDYGILEHLDTVDPTPFHFISSLENTDLIQQLDEAVGYLEIAEPSLHQRLLSTYFSDYATGAMVLSPEETELLEEIEYFNIGLMRNIKPYQFYDETKDLPQGISPEILSLLSKMIGVEFRYVWVDSYDEMAEKIKTQEIDFCATLPFDYDLSSHFGIVLTRPYITSGVIWLHQNSEKEDVEYYYHFVTNNIPHIPDEQLKKVEDIEDVITMLSETGTISVICDPYIAQYHMQQLAITNVDTQNLSNILSEISLGVGKHIDTTLVGLLNRAILHLDPYELDEIVYRNVSNTGQISLEAFVRQHTTAIICSIILFFAVILVALAYHAHKMRMLAQQDSLTKLYNSGFFHHYADEKSKKLTNGVLILFDIDYFKQVNDTHGHQVGDKVIICVAQNVAQLFQNQGVVARLGGDEFVALLEGDRGEMEEKCKLLQDNLDISVENVPISLSIGGIFFHEPTPYKELYRLADECLYEVKENGKKNFRFGEKNQ